MDGKPLDIKVHPSLTVEDLLEAGLHGLASQTALERKKGHKPGWRPLTPHEKKVHFEAYAQGRSVYAGELHTDTPHQPEDFGTTDTEAGPKHFAESHPRFGSLLKKHGFNDNQIRILKAVSAPWTVSEGFTLPIGQLRAVIATQGASIGISKPASLAAGNWNLSMFSMRDIMAAHNGQEENEYGDYDPAYPEVGRMGKTDIRGMYDADATPVVGLTNTEIINQALVVLIAWQAGDEPWNIDEWSGYNADRFWKISGRQGLGYDPCAFLSAAIKYVYVGRDIDRAGYSTGFRQEAPKQPLAIQYSSEMRKKDGTASTPYGPFHSVQLEVQPTPAVGDSNVLNLTSETLPGGVGGLMVLPINYTELPHKLM